MCTLLRLQSTRKQTGREDHEADQTTSGVVRSRRDTELDASLTAGVIPAIDDTGIRRVKLKTKHETRTRAGSALEL